MSIKNPLMAIALVSCAAFGGSAYATDFKVMPGSACQPRSPDNRQDIFATLDGVTNTNPTELAFVLCPIVRDNTSTNPNGVLRVKLFVQGSSTNDELVSCLLDSRQATGTEIARDEAASDGNFLRLAVGQNPSRDGYYVVQCALPPGGTVVSYSYVESSPTDENN